MTRLYTLDANSDPQPCDDLLAWAKWFETAERHVAHDMDEGDGDGKVRVSTVFLGLDHSFGAGPPVLWETLVLGGPLDGEMDRYTSKAAALVGHQTMCERVTASRLASPEKAQ